jgi:spore coat polysaccharide biosynthesis protein SpsF
MARVKIIAELGSCHDRNVATAERMVIEAAENGADYVKLQYWSSAQRLAERRQSGPGYQAIYEQYQIERGWLEHLARVAEIADVGFMCTAYLPEDIEIVAPYVDHFKVASFEAGDMEFITAHYPYCQKNRDRWLIVSTGLQGDSALRRLLIERDRRHNEVALKLLHCVSAYPAPTESLHLRQIRSMNFDGFSDHAAAGWIASGAVAVALGAKILEVHVRPATMDEQNPDSPHALMPGQFRRYVEHVRLAEAAIGDEGWRSDTNPAEDAMRPYKVQRAAQGARRAGPDEPAQGRAGAGGNARAAQAGQAAGGIEPGRAVSDNVIAVVQARMSSTRLPGKVLRLIEGIPTIGRMVQRLSYSRTLGGIIVACSVNPADDPIAAYCSQNRIAFVRGPEKEVDQRLLMALDHMSGDALVRITADCPLVDPALLDILVAMWLEGTPGIPTPPDYVSNVYPNRTYPDGLDLEVISRGALEFIVGKVGGAPWDHEALTTNIWRHPHLFQGIQSLDHTENLGELRWTVDRPDDLEFIRWVYRSLPEGFGWQEVLALKDDWIRRRPAGGQIEMRFGR